MINADCFFFKICETIVTTLKTYRDRIKYMQLLDNIKLKDLSVKHYELWRKEINKADISTAYKNDIQKFIKIVLN